MTDCCWFSAHGGSARQWWGPGSDSAFDHMIRRSASADLNRNRRLSDRHRRSLSVVKATKLWPFVSGPRPTTLAVALILTFASSSWRLRWSRAWPERSQNPSVADQVDKKQITAVRASSNRHSPCVSRQILYRARARARAFVHSRGDREEEGGSATGRRDFLSVTEPRLQRPVASFFPTVVSPL